MAETFGPGLTHYLGLTVLDDSDRACLADLNQNRFANWRKLSRVTIEAAGQHELLNSICLAGAMTETGAKAHIVDYLETYALNSNKCFAVFPT